MAFRIRRKQSVNINRVVVKITATIIALYVGGTIIIELGNVMNCTASPFYQGLTLIGWSVGTVNASGLPAGVACTTINGATPPATGLAGTIYDVGGSGILSVIGIVGIASIVTEFVTFSM